MKYTAPGSQFFYNQEDAVSFGKEFNIFKTCELKSAITNKGVEMWFWSYKVVDEYTLLEKRISAIEDFLKKS